jgi:hypothetical protein
MVMGIPRRASRGWWVAVLVGLLAAITEGNADPLSIGRWTVDSGGSAYVTTGTFTLGGTAGQPDAGVLANGLFLLTGGFWGPGLVPTTAVDPEPEPAPSGEPLPLALRLYPAAPNPLSDRTQIRFDLPEPLAVEVRMYDVTGAQVRVLAEGSFPAGHHAVRWDGADSQGRHVRAGLYWARVRLGTVVRTQRLVVLR